MFRSHTYLSGSLAVTGACFFALLCSCLGPDLEPPFSGGDNEAAATPPTDVKTADTADTGGRATPAAGSGGAVPGGGGAGGNAHTGPRAGDEVDADAGVAGAGAGAGH